MSLVRVEASADNAIDDAESVPANKTKNKTKQNKTKQNTDQSKHKQIKTQTVETLEKIGRQKLHNNETEN
jgi:sorbitol-specific phosphotransferase system component IIBC